MIINLARNDHDLFMCIVHLIAPSPLEMDHLLQDTVLVCILKVVS